MQRIETTEAPGAIGPYSQAVIAGDFLFTSGQIALDPVSQQIVSDDLAQQAEQVMKNLGAILRSANLDFTNVVKTTCFLADMADFGRFNEIYAKYFTEKPARSCVAVKTLPKNVLCEVEVIAYRKTGN
ncbi:MAG: RidA family protein [Lachnospiraceae bacterium]|jgi:2-iminobutanoate/2-iminopropanoate deaminase|nr:RidA family protein [Lachnospiraceae bacterium]